ncbi:Vacuolar assembly/sorting proteins VPS39/VAM6/VPS3 [Plasmopara halstedii]|uniref:Vacuolar assembly/sorting proteins VPS39/VAM6/VPS3 n=1 Tax=Plasmopara halstedii TaxID=4781 RepID=A0A0N7L5P2_PLAHL|nr:Vacuolar assembly/sorting proteins VPS39/VAM6/VPS3 [Plasmopara halstedii]CEG42027.1 Vacuolar assembly/sorting proteins VPS39/VAM6/VPS3 [Plasmopara halstedii]|eukprot:XP_024578396.1 Vacuolar assembly/sorting proteins VPS39/VAM6/VPS3 [Plasmopara halstedii]
MSERPQAMEQASASLLVTVERLAPLKMEIVALRAQNQLLVQLLGGRGPVGSTPAPMLPRSPAPDPDTWGVFITLSDNRLKLVDLPLKNNPQLIDRDDTKGAVLFATHEAAKTLCVLLKTNIVKVFDWTINRVLELRTQHELLPSLLPVQQLVLLSENYLFVQGKTQWSVLHLDSGRMLNVAADVLQDITEALEGANGKCDALALPSRFMARRRQHVMDLLLCGKRNGVILTIHEEEKTSDNEEIADVYGAFGTIAVTMGQRASKALDVSTNQLCLKVDRKFAYNTTPRRAYYHHPFLLLDQADHISVYNYGSLRFAQSLLVKSPYSICAALNVASATAEDRGSLHRDDRPATLYTVSPPFTFQTHQMLPIAQQVAASMKIKCLDDAVALCKLCPEDDTLSDADQRALYAEYGYSLFRSRSLQQAMLYFYESSIEVMEVLLLFPRNLIPRKYSAIHKNSNKKEYVLEGDDLKESLLALIGFLRHKRSAYSQDNVKASAMIKRENNDIDSREVGTLELIDTMLVKCLVVVAEEAEYEKRAKRALLKVVTGENWCEIGETEVFLRAHRRFEALLAFYTARKLHRKALELLEDLERSAASTAVHTPSEATEHLSEDSRDLLSSHDYMVLIAQYLRRLGQKHAELIFEFSRRVLSVDPSLGLSIFTQRDVADSRRDIDHAAVLQHIKSCSIASSCSSDIPLGTDTSIPADISTLRLPLINCQMLAIEYLIQVINERPCDLTPRLHDEVVYLLLDAIHKSSSHNQHLTSRVELQGGMTGLLRRKLLSFLEYPRAAYHPERMLSRTPIEMVDERAALLSKLGRHLEVLQLYALQLEDATLAEAYCNRCFDSKTADSSIYSTLLKIYLSPQIRKNGSASSPLQSFGSASFSSDPQSKAIHAAINVLNKYAERIDVSTALDLLPADIPMALLAEFFRRVLERKVERFRNGQVKKHLSKMENFMVRGQLSLLRQESVTVWSSQCCQSCGKKLGVGAFVRFPVGLVHYSCQPVT